MKLNDAKRDFIHSWGDLHVAWGSSKTTGLVHGLLLLSTEPLCANTIMDALSISRGSSNTSTRLLIDYGLAHKQCIEGERREFFVAEKNAYSMFRAVVELRRKKELQPILDTLDTLNCIEPTCKESEEYAHVIKDLHHFSTAVDNALDKMLTCDPKWLVNSYIHKP